MSGDNTRSSSVETRWMMPRGTRYAGQAVDGSSRRSITIVPQGEYRQGEYRELIGPQDTHVVVDHFYHESTFWRAVIPLDGVDEVFGQAFNFSTVKTRKGEHGREIVYGKHGVPKYTNPILNHVQCRFTLKPDCPLELYPLASDTQGVPAHRIFDCVYSFEVVGPVGVLFNLRDGLVGNLLGAHRFLSTREMVFERIVVENQYVAETAVLPLGKAEKRVLLAKSLLRSHRAGMAERYYLFRMCGTNNCTSSPFQMLDSVVDYRLPQRVGAMLYRLPINPKLYLRVRGMDSDPSVTKLVRHEFEDYIRAPETQERKRTYVRLQTNARRTAREARASGE